MVTPFDVVDPRLRASLLAEYERRRAEPVEGLPRGVTVVLAGHRAAGKSTLLPVVANALGREPVDLDLELERVHRRSIREWFAADAASFRRAEREVFRALPPGRVVAVGGGFLSLHADLLVGQVTVEVPISFESYVERLRADSSRPRLRPELPLEDELRGVWHERSEQHRAAKPLSLVDFWLRVERGTRPRRVVTLAPGESPAELAWRARHAGADLLEVRTDLTEPTADLRAAARAVPLLISQRTAEVPEAWRSLATLVDHPLEQGGGGSFVSFHAERPLSTAEALAQWEAVPVGTMVKHIEPLTAFDQVPTLFATREALARRFGPDAVTVLPMGPLALPFRAVMARRNALDYLALDASWAAAPGQRLLADARREWVSSARDGERDRRGILGHSIFHSRSPRIHQPPFDRIDLPAEVDVEAVLHALRPFYSGFAVTNPFKKRVALAVGASRGAVNTLARGEGGWRSHNSDVDGARAVLEALGERQVYVLGDGGVGEALREAAGADFTLHFLRRESIPAQPLTGTVIWTWPVSVEAPPGLRFEGARVAVVAYGGPAHAITRTIRALGGTPVRLGPRWFVAQARGQRKMWGA